MAYPIIFLISLPRSNSTAFLRMMENRKDMAILHELGVYAYHKKLAVAQGNSEFTSDLVNHQFPSYAAVAKHIEEQSQQGVVFVKEMAFAAQGYLQEEFSLLDRENVFYFFLVRDPAECFVSHYQKMPLPIDETMAEILSYKLIYDLQQKVSAKAPERTFILRAETLIANPEQSVREFCRNAQIPFLPQSLQWPALQANFEGEKNNGVWNYSTNCKFLEHWHNTALQSTHFDGGLIKAKARDKDGNASFTEIFPEHRQAYQAHYAQQLPYYSLLMQQIKAPPLEIVKENYQNNNHFFYNRTVGQNAGDDGIIAVHNLGK